jgi:hypothetical protein
MGILLVRRQFKAVDVEAKVALAQMAGMVLTQSWLTR